MLISETTISVDRPGRYLVQLCKHAAAMGATGGGHRPRAHAVAGALGRGDLRVQAEYSDTQGIVTISPWGRCTLRANAETLTLRVEANDETALRQIQQIVTRDLERFGRRDQVTITWPPLDTSDTNTPATDRRAASASVAKTGRSRVAIVMLVALAALAIAIHLGLTASILTSPRWADLSIGVIAAIVAAKILLAAFGGRAIHRIRSHGGARRSRGNSKNSDVEAHVNLSGHSRADGD